MKIIKEFHEAEIIIEKSRFIAHAYQVNSIEEASVIINENKKKYWDATHNCLAFIIGKNQEYMRSSDDGEPNGTAGVPILEAIKKGGITNTLVIVTRYFGGIKLGAGGLVRAYSKATSTCLSQASYIEKKELAHYMLALSYSEANKCLDYIKNQTHFINVNYEASINIEFATSDIDSLKMKLQNTLNREINPTFIDIITIDIQV